MNKIEIKPCTCGCKNVMLEFIDNAKFDLIGGGYLRLDLEIPDSQNDILDWHTYKTTNGADINKVEKFINCDDYSCQITCLNCLRYIEGSLYIIPETENDSYFEQCLKDWNNGLTMEDLDKREDEWASNHTEYLKYIEEKYFK